MMGRLVNCPECGGVTHPFAEQLVAGTTAEPSAAKANVTADAPSPRGRQEKAAAAAHQVRHCDNCGRLIGRLEQSHVWQGNLVCDDCHGHLPYEEAPAAKVARRRPAPKAAAAADTAAPIKAVQVLEARRVVRKDDPTGGVAEREPSRVAMFLSTKPARVLLALCTLALAIYFVYSFVQVIGLVANLLVVGLLLLAALFFLFRPGPRSIGETSSAPERSLARRS
jgi:hypothetical protein